MEFAHYKCPIIIIIISHIQASTYINKKKVLLSRVDWDIDLNERFFFLFFFFFPKGLYHHLKPSLRVF